MANVDRVLKLQPEMLAEPLVQTCGQTGVQNAGWPLVAVPMKGILGSTLIETTNGPTAIQRIRRGDKVRMAGGDLATVAFALVRHSALADTQNSAFAAITIEKDAFGAGRPARDICVTADHMICLTSDSAETLFGSASYLVRAGDLIDMPGVSARRAGSACWVELVFEEHAMFDLGGLCVESFITDAASLAARAPAERDALYEAEPRLRYAGTHAAYISDQVALNRREIRLLSEVEACAQDAKPSGASKRPARAPVPELSFQVHPDVSAKRLPILRSIWRARPSTC